MKQVSRWAWFSRKVLESARYDGLPSCLWRIFVKCFSPVGRLRLINVYWLELTQPIRLVRAKIELRIVEATEADLEDLFMLKVQFDQEFETRERDVTPGRKREIYSAWAERLRQGERCFVAKVGDTAVHYDWVLLKQMRLLPAPCAPVALAEDEAYLSEAFTARPWRGKGIHPAVTAEMVASLQSSGYRRVYTRVDTDNLSSRKTFEGLGWQRMALMLRFLPRGSSDFWITCLSGTLEPLALGRRRFAWYRHKCPQEPR